MDMHSVFNSLKAKVVGRAVSGAAPHSASGEQVAVAMMVVVTAILYLYLAAHLYCRCTTELSPDHYKRVLQHSARF